MNAMEEPIPIEKLVDGKTLASILGVAYSTVTRMAGANLIPSVLIGSRCGSRRYNLSKVLAILEENSRGRVVTAKAHRRGKRRTPQAEPEVRL